MIKNLARNTHSFSESIAKRLEQFIAAGVIAPGDVSALTQVHCHEKSLGDPQHSAAVLRALGIKEEQITTGCCGLAGNRGFEKDHAEVSMALGERELFPKVRKATTEGKVVIADGFSCRTQIERGQGAMPSTSLRSSTASSARPATTTKQAPDKTTTSAGLPPQSREDRPLAVLY
ncbi:hypothetical protein QP414_05580 [Corynebacterium simulans]|nr:hypothetical protein [Corynebacterium simulans]MDK7138779.1 hypothetical protein [Corynebacterium simulans]